MNCSAARQLIDAYMDSELDSSHAIQIEAHLSECPACKRILESRQELSKAIKVAAAYMPAPASLQVHIRRQTNIRRRPRFGLLSTGLAFGVGIVLVVAIWRPWNSLQNRVINEVLTQHQRSEAAPNDVQVSSPDTAKIQTWFSSKISYTPHVPDLHKEGFTLKGGRLDVIGGHTVPVLVYTHDHHTIDIFIAPGEPDKIADADRDGLHVRSWYDCGLSYWAVSNDTPDDMATLNQKYFMH